MKAAIFILLILNTSFGYASYTGRVFLQESGKNQHGLNVGEINSFWEYYTQEQIREIIKNASSSKSEWQGYRLHDACESEAGRKGGFYWFFTPLTRLFKKQ